MKDWQYLETEAAWPRRALAPWMSLGWDLVAVVKRYEIGHFRVPKTLTFKMRLGAQPFLWKWVLFAWKWKMISISEAEHLPSFWNRGPGELGNGLLRFIHRHRVNRSVTTNSRSWFLERWLILSQGLSQILSTVFFSTNIQYCWPLLWDTVIIAQNVTVSNE